MISVPFGETNRNHQLQLRLSRQDGKDLPLGFHPANASDPAGVPTPITKMEGVINLGRPPMLQQGDAQTLAMAVNIDGLMLDEPDAYTLLVGVDGNEIGRGRFRAYPAASAFRTS